MSSRKTYSFNRDKLALLATSPVFVIIFVASVCHIALNTENLIANIIIVIISFVAIVLTISYYIQLRCASRSRCEIQAILGGVDNKSQQHNIVSYVIALACSTVCFLGDTVIFYISGLIIIVTIFNLIKNTDYRFVSPLLALSGYKTYNAYADFGGEAPMYLTIISKHELNNSNEECSLINVNNDYWVAT